MERHVKERLVGAAVLMAAAIILIPEMLSGPDRDDAAASAPRAARDTALKTYTIDLHQPQEGAAPTSLDERAPPPETAPAEAPAAPTVEPRSERQADSQPQTIEPSPATASATTQQPVLTPPAAARDNRAAASSASTAAPAPPAVVPRKDSRTGAWAVQIGSYSRQPAAERLAGELRTAGHTAFVMPIQSGGATLYRVRIGPMNDRTAAAAALSELKPKFPGAAVVSHP